MEKEKMKRVSVMLPIRSINEIKKRAKGDETFSVLIRKYIREGLEK